MKRIISGLFVFLMAFSVVAVSAERNKADLARDKTSKPDEIIKFAGVKKGQKVLDFLGGGGYYSEILATAVGNEGSVVLHNNQAYIPYVGKELEERLKGNRLKNVTRLMSEASELNFGEGEFDHVFLVLGYHDFFYKDKGWDVSADVVMPQVLKALKTGGKLLVIDHNAAVGEKSNQTKSLHRVEEGFVKEDIEKRGFKYIKSSEMLKNPADPLNIIVFDPSVRRNTDRFVLQFEKQ